MRQEVIDYIKNLSEEERSAEIYIDRSDELTEEQIRGIVNAETKDKMYEAMDEIENDIIESGYFDVVDERRDELIKEITAKFDLDEEEIKELVEYFDESVELFATFDMDSLIGNTDDIHLTIAYGNKENPKYEDDFLMLPAMWRESVADSDYYKQDLSDTCALLGIDKSEMEKAYTKYHSLDTPLILPEPKIPMGATQTTAEELIYDWENATSDYGIATFMTRISLESYIAHFDRIKEDGIVIPEGAYFGLHDPMNGSCSLMNIAVKHPIVLPHDRINISIGDKEHNFGYSLDQICGLTEEAWGPAGAYANIIRTKEEERILSMLSELQKMNPKRESIGALMEHTAFRLKSEIENGKIDARKGLSNKEIFESSVNYTNSVYWYKKEIPDDIRERIAFGVAQSITEYVSGTMTIERVNFMADYLTDTVKKYKDLQAMKVTNEAQDNKPKEEGVFAENTVVKKSLFENQPVDADDTPIFTIKR